MKLLVTLFLAACGSISSTQDGAQRLHAWQQTEPYRAPDFESTFPDDVQGGARLDALHAENRLRSLPDAEYLAALRNGLRHTKQHRTLLISDLGNRFIWNQAEQNAEAIELSYHAADFREQAARYGTRHHAVYFGLSVVSHKTPAILRTLADLCVEIDSVDDLRRVAWGAATQREELLTYLTPHLESPDESVRRKADSVRRILLGELEVSDWAARRAREPARPPAWDEMPEVRAVLREGNSAERLAMLGRIQAEDLTARMNDSYLADFAAAARDGDPRVRKQVARVAGSAWIWSAGLHLVAPEAVELLLSLSHDVDESVRHDAVYFGLSTYRGEDDRVLQRMLDLLMDPAEAGSHGRLRWGLKKVEERVTALLEPALSGDDAARARAAYHTYQRLFEKAPPIVPPGIAQPAQLAGTWQVTAQAPPQAAGTAVSFTVRRAEDGALWLKLGEDDLSLGDLLDVELDGALHFNFNAPIEGTALCVSGRLEGDRMTGTARLDSKDVLVVWSATRVP